MKHPRISVIAFAIASSSMPAIAQNLPGDMPDMRLLAGSEDGKVFLKWVVASGWIPNGKGFQIYRISNGVKQGPLNPTPLNVQPDAPAVAALPVHKRFSITVRKVAQTATAPSLDISALIRLASQTVAGKTSRQVFSLTPSNRIRVKSSDQFLAVQKSVVQTIGKPPRFTPPSQFLAKSLQTANVPSISRRIDPTIRRFNPPVSNAVISPGNSAENSIRAARAALGLGILARSEVATQMGSSFTDEHAQAGATYTYVLTFTTGVGPETELARQTITVGKDILPTPPPLVRAMQTRDHQVTLDWDAAPDAALTQFGIDTYNIYRSDVMHPQPVLLTPHPIAKSSKISDDGTKLVENWFMFQDSTAPVGQISYQVRLVDGLGRESAAGTSATVAVADWSVPAEPTAVNAIFLPSGNTNQTIVNFTAPNDSNANYHVYRVDSEKPNAQPQLLKTLQPKDGSNIPPQAVDSNGVHIIHPNPPDPKNTYFTAQDSGLPIDHHFRYLVSGFYSVNKYESAPANSNVIAVPVTTPPPAPGSLSGKQGIAVPPASKGPKFLKSVNRTMVARLFGGASPTVPFLVAPAGSSVALTWAAPGTLGAPFTYKIYRLHLTPPSPPINLGNLGNLRIPQSKGGAPVSSHQIMISSTKIHRGPTVIRKTPVARTLLANHLQMVQSPSMAKIIAANAPTAASTSVATGQTTDPSFTDNLTPSQIGEDYSYYVVATDRWGNQSPASAPLAIHVKPTIPPSLPHLSAAFPRQDDRTQIILNVAPSITDQEVTSYRVFRGDLGPHIYVLFPFSIIVDPTRKGIKVNPTGPKIGQGKTPKQIIDNDGNGNGENPHQVEETFARPDPNTMSYNEVPAASITKVVQSDGSVYLIDTGCTTSHDYTYKVVAVNSGGLSSLQTTFLTATSYPTSPSAPDLSVAFPDSTGVRFTYQVDQEAVLYKSADGTTVFTYSVGTGPVNAPSGKVILERRLESSSTWIPILTQSTTQIGKVLFDDSPILGQKYRYRLRAADSLGNMSPTSIERSVTYQPTN